MLGLKYFGSSCVLAFQFLEMCIILKQGSQLLQESQLCFKSSGCITCGKSNSEHEASFRASFLGRNPFHTQLTMGLDKRSASVNNQLPSIYISIW